MRKLSLIVVTLGLLLLLSSCGKKEEVRKAAPPLPLPSGIGPTSPPNFAGPSTPPPSSPAY